MEAVLSGHEQSSIPNPFLSNHYLKEQMGLTVTLLHERQISLTSQILTGSGIHTEGHGGTCGWIGLDATAGRLCSGQEGCYFLVRRNERGISENTCACSQERGRIHTYSSHAQQLLESSKLFSFRETENVYTCTR